MEQFRLNAGRTVTISAMKTYNQIRMTSKEIEYRWLLSMYAVCVWWKVPNSL